MVKCLAGSDERLIYDTKHNSVSSSKDWYNKHKSMGLRTKDCDLSELREHNMKLEILQYGKGISICV